jgi:hypothetical protein
MKERRESEGERERERAALSRLKRKNNDAAIDRGQA